MGEWSNLTQREKSNIIRFAIKNGVSDINTIRDTFNVYAKDSLANVDYNMAAAKASGFGSNGNGHYPDTFKRPNHPTFSDESIYHSEATPGGRWRGNTYEPSDFVLNQQGGWNQFLRGFYNQEQGTGAVPVFNGGIMLPEVTVNPQYKEGGKIYIKPSKRGTFTSAATKHGKSVQEFARQVLANKENYSPAMVKKANFARNAAGWKHSTGGPLYPFSFQKNPYWKTPVVRYAEGGKKTEGSVDPATIASRQAYAESTYRDSAGSDVGAKGIFQIMQPTLDDYNKANKDSVKLEDLISTDTSLAVRNWYMDNLLGASFIDKPESTDSIKYGKALAAYNWGRGNVLKALNKAKAAGEDIYDSWGWLPYLEQEPRDYVNFILRGINVNPSHKNEVMYQAAKTLNKSKDTKIRNSQK